MRGVDEEFKSRLLKVESFNLLITVLFCGAGIIVRSWRPDQQ